MKGESYPSFLKKAPPVKNNAINNEPFTRAWTAALNLGYHIPYHLVFRIQKEDTDRKRGETELMPLLFQESPAVRLETRNVRVRLIMYECF
jgi:hypothetical protein